MQRVPLHDHTNQIVAYARVDDDDYKLVSALRWHRHSHGRQRYAYARHCTGIYMHRLILGLEKGDRRIVDHINRNGLDNRKANLRAGTQGQNMENRAGPQNSLSVYRGVTYDGRRKPLAKRWIAHVKVNGERAFFKRFATEEEAAAAAAEARQRLMPRSHCNVC